MGRADVGNLPNREEENSYRRLDYEDPTVPINKAQHEPASPALPDLKF